MTSQALADLKPLAITMGDAAGIGPEIIAKAYRDDPMALQGCFVVGDVATLRRAARVVAPAGMLAAAGGLHHASHRRATRAPALHPGATAARGFGSDSLGAGECCRWRVCRRLCGVGGPCGVARVRGAMVTAPLHKEALHAAGLPFSAFPGHTELLQCRSRAASGRPRARYAGPHDAGQYELRTVLVSIHLSLRDAIAAVTYDNVVQTLQITHDALSRLLGRAPRIAVAGLNPHAGEGGLFGREEIEVIQPAIEAARQKGQDVSGPYAPDTIFMRARQKSLGRA